MDKITVNKESFSKVFDKTVHTGKSCGPDNVSATDLLLHKISSIHSLFGVFKKRVETGLFPIDWKKAKVTCVYKKGSKESPAETNNHSHYCLFKAKYLSDTSVLSKIIV